MSDLASPAGGPPVSSPAPSPPAPLTPHGAPIVNRSSGELAASAGATAVLDDPSLARRVRAGDREAIEAVVRAYLGQVFRAARGAGLDPRSVRGSPTLPTRAWGVFGAPSCWFTPHHGNSF